MGHRLVVEIFERLEDSVLGMTLNSVLSRALRLSYSHVCA